jgi:hypothetical protein
MIANLIDAGGFGNLLVWSFLNKKPKIGIEPVSAAAQH